MLLVKPGRDMNWCCGFFAISQEQGGTVEVMMILLVTVTCPTRASLSFFKHFLSVSLSPGGGRTEEDGARCVSRENWELASCAADLYHETSRSPHIPTDRYLMATCVDFWQIMARYVSQLWQLMATYTTRRCTYMRKAGDTGDISPPIFWIFRQILGWERDFRPF